MPALTGQGKLPTVMLSKQLSSLMDVENYTDEYSLSDTLTTFQYTAGLPGAASNSFTATLTVINPTEHFERTVLPHFRTMFAQQSQNSNLQAGPDDDPHALEFYVRWGYGSTEQGMSKIIHGFLTSINYSITAEGERTIVFSLLDQLSFATSKYPELGRENSVQQVWEYPDILKPDGSFNPPSVVVEDLLSQMLASVPHSKGHFVLGNAGQQLDQVWMQLTTQLATGFGETSLSSITEGSPPQALPLDLAGKVEGDCQWITAADNLKINAPGSHYAAARIAYDMVMRSLGIKSGGGEVGETRSDAVSAPKPQLQEVPTIDTRKDLPELNNYKLDKSYLVYKVDENGLPQETGKNLGQWLSLYKYGDETAVNEVFDTFFYTHASSIDGRGEYADEYGFPNEMPWRPGGAGYNVANPANSDSQAKAGKVLDLCKSGWFPLSYRDGNYPTPGYYVGLGPLNYDILPPQVDHITSTALSVRDYAVAFSTKMDEASDSAATHAKTVEPLESPTQDKPQTKYRASIVKGKYNTYMEVLDSIVGKLNGLLLPVITEEDELLRLVPYFKSNLITPNDAGLQLWDNLLDTVNLTAQQVKEVNTILLLANKNIHKACLTDDAASDPSEISKLCALNSFPSISENLPAGRIRGVEDGSITSLLLFKIGYDNSIVTSFNFDNDLFAPVVGNAQSQMYIQKLNEVWGKGSGGISTNNTLKTIEYVLEKGIEGLNESFKTASDPRTLSPFLYADKGMDANFSIQSEDTVALWDAQETAKESLVALKNIEQKTLDVSEFLDKMNAFYTKYQRVNQEGLFSASEDTAERLNALFSLINSSIFKQLFISPNGNEHSYVINGKEIAVKSTPQWKLDMSLLSQIDKEVSLVEFLKKKGMWDKGFAQFPFKATVTTLGIPELSSFVEDDAFRKINLQVSNPRLPEGPKHWTSGIYQILGYSHSISADSVYTTSFDLLRQPFVEFN